MIRFQRTIVLSCPPSILGLELFSSLLGSLHRFVSKVCSDWQLPCILCVAVPMLQKEHAGNCLLPPKLCLGLFGTDRYGRRRGWSSAEGCRVNPTVLQADPHSLSAVLAKPCFSLLQCAKGLAGFTFLTASFSSDVFQNKSFPSYFLPVTEKTPYPRQ